MKENVRNTIQTVSYFATGLDYKGRTSQNSSAFTKKFDWLPLGEAYRKEQIPFSLHIFEKGGHGLSLCNTETNNQTEVDKRLSYIGKWVELALDWLTARGFVVETSSEDQK